MKRLFFLALLLGSLAVVTGCGLTDPDPVTGVSPLQKGAATFTEQALKDPSPAGLIIAGITAIVAGGSAWAAVRYGTPKKAP